MESNIGPWKTDFGQWKPTIARWFILLNKPDCEGLITTEAEPCPKQDGKMNITWNGNIIQLCTVPNRAVRSLYIQDNIPKWALGLCAIYTPLTWQQKNPIIRIHNKYFHQNSPSVKL